MNTTLFNNTKTAFSLKSNAELKRAYLLFKMIASNTLVSVGTKLTNFALKLNLPVTGLIRATVFDHFCGGTTEDDCLKVIDKLYTKSVSSILDYSVEGKATDEEFDAALNKKLKIIDFCVGREAMPFLVFKPTGLGRFYLFQKKTEQQPFTTEEEAEWQRIVQRFNAICKKAHDNNVLVLIDAEETWMQTAADDLVAQMMQQYNQNQVIVYNTLQCYRWDRLDYLKTLHQQAQTQGFKIGVKIVRGAYMEKERERAEAKGYQSPICKDKAATDANFNTTLNYILDNRNDIAVFIGTHNAESCVMAANYMLNNNIAKNDNSIWFGQLYGMSDHISFNLANEGFNVAKNLPFGPVKDVMPYLIRRAQENTSVAGQTNRELQLLTAEIKRRKL